MNRLKRLFSRIFPKKTYPKCRWCGNPATIKSDLSKAGYGNVTRMTESSIIYACCFEHLDKIAEWYFKQSFEYIPPKNRIAKIASEEEKTPKMA